MWPAARRPTSTRAAVRARIVAAVAPHDFRHAGLALQLSERTLGGQITAASKSTLFAMGRDLAT
jgi:hypothetical protein